MKRTPPNPAKHRRAKPTPQKILIIAGPNGAEKATFA
jgi:hypothetical protein